MDSGRQDTQAIHAGSVRDAYGAITVPVYRASTFGFASMAESAGRAAALLGGQQGHYFYTRLGNPTNAALERRLAALEGAQDCVVTASGMGAIAAVMWTFLSSGDHVLADTALYGDTHELLSKSLSKFGVEVTFADFTDLDAVRAALRPRTALVYFETPCNPTLKVNDIAAVSAAAHEHSASVRVVVDSTFATPSLQNPLGLGADLVVHSLTKYLGGHSDAVGGCVCGPTADISRLRYEGIQRNTGSVLAPDNAFLVLRGIATLPVRMRAHCATAAAVARYLDDSPRVARVHYPGLASHPGHEVASRQMRMYGGMVSVELNASLAETRDFVDRLKLVSIAVSLGGVETLVEHPASMTHAGLTDEQLRAAGIAPALIRLSVGLEDARDIINDLAQALA